MCPPRYFAVSYAINPWMDVFAPVDQALAMRQWESLRRTYLDLGHQVDVIEPLPGQPDMVFAANGGLVVGGVAVGARFAHAERAAEGPAYLKWLAAQAAAGELAAVHEPAEVNEAEGDFLVIGDVVLAGHGFRTTRAAHEEVQALTGRAVTSLRLVDPRYYHLDTAMAVLDESNIAYLPSAFSAGSRQLLRRLFPDAVVCSPEESAVLGLNAVSDGRHVVTAAQAIGLMRDLAARGYQPVGVDLSELAKAGGGVKCCTMELRSRAG